MQAYSPSPAASASYLKDSRPQSNVFTDSKEVFEPTESAHFLPTQPASAQNLNANGATPPHQNQQTKRRRRRNLALIGVGVVLLLFLAVFLPIFFTVIRKKHTFAATDSAGAVGGTGSGTPNPNSPSGAISGADGSTVKLDNGTEFQYKNPFGGFWVQDPGNPFNDNARPNSWTPPLNTSWKWGTDRVYGVNLGGLFVLEPFITPAIFQRYPDAVDEYTLSQAMAADTANGGLKQLEDHYNTFITEQDIAAIAGAGLNWLRIPIAFWAIETWEGEPFLAKTSWKYFLRVLTWARKYGLRVSLDLHAVPGSQNGYNHSGRLLNNTANFLVGNMGLANAQRTLYYIRVLTEFISQPEYKNLIPVFGIVNEALVKVIGTDSITSFYLEAHDMIRNITGKGEGNGPYISIHDGFLKTTVWDNFLQGSDRIIMDTHPYFSFGGVQTAPVAVIDETSGQPGGKWPLTACNAWGPSLNDSRTTFGVTYAGEFAASPNDCGLYLRGVGQLAKTPDCTPYDQWESYNATMKEGIQNFVKASMDSFGDWFFWTWKIAPSQAGRIEAPLWSYSLGLAQGWIPQDPRTPFGTCASLNAESAPFAGTFQPWQTGTPSSIPASSSASFPWPPASLVSANVPVSLLPTYTNTAPVVTMPAATFTAAPSRVTQSVNGWFDAKDSGLAPTAVAGCVYPSEYDGIFAVVPTAPCTGAGGGVASGTATATSAALTATSTVAALTTTAAPRA